MCGFCCAGKFFGERDNGLFVCFDAFSIGDLDAGSGVRKADVSTVFFGGSVEIMTGGSCVDDGGGLGKVCCGEWVGCRFI